MAQYLLDGYATKVYYKEKENPMFHWAIPFVTGHKYFVRWNQGLDFDDVKIQISPELWDNENDGDVFFVLPHYEDRAEVIFSNNVSGEIKNNTLTTVPESERVMGTNVVYN